MTAVRRSGHVLFVDTSALFALFDPRDSSHLAAVRLAGRVTQQRQQLLSTNFVVAEAHALTQADGPIALNQVSARDRGHERRSRPSNRGR